MANQKSLKSHIFIEVKQKMELALFMPMPPYIQLKKEKELL